MSSRRRQRQRHLGLRRTFFKPFLEGLPADPDQELVLVPHSNAGLYVPALARQRGVTAFIFVDALLPVPSGRIPLAPPADLLDFLRAKADENGMLPPWTAWWEEADVAGLFPDKAARERVESEQKRLPLSYFEASMRIPSGWDQLPGAYLAFGDTYAEDRAAAIRRGWPVATLEHGRHLHMLFEPEVVADQVLSLVAAGCRQGPRSSRSSPSQSSAQDRRPGWVSRP